ncbi:MAG: hypothetical protein F9K40_06155 [Kofleriaceae bacterium]|nr:MAG: hypothetical protein F9K40_06155 [Kofleriaceae bacterium]
MRSLLTVVEYQEVTRDALGATVCRELQRLDESWAASTGESIFDWSRLKTIRAKNWVGVLEVPGLTVEILPKIDGLKSEAARRNLLYMLSIAGELPIRERDLASVAVDRMSLLDALVLVFSERLVRELALGLDHAYVRREENLGFVRGKLLLAEHFRRNIGHDERMFVAYDEFHADTPLNRILKRACRVLLAKTRSPAAERNLQAAVRALDDVADIEVLAHHFEQVQLSRTSARFESLLEFCRIALLDGAPALRSGKRVTFTLLFPMEKVFEQFVARALVKYSAALALHDESIAIQARGMRRNLARDPEGKGRFRLEPDIVVHRGSQARLILDTKWKRLLTSAEDSKNGVSQSDMYQMTAYATRYDCNDNVLVFPRVPDVGPVAYVVPSRPADRSIRVEFIDLSMDLRTNREALLRDLARLVGRGSSGSSSGTLRTP